MTVNNSCFDLFYASLSFKKSFCRELALWMRRSFLMYPLTGCLWNLSSSFKYVVTHLLVGDVVLHCCLSIIFWGLTCKVILLWLPLAWVPWWYFAYIFQFLDILSLILYLSTCLASSQECLSMVIGWYVGTGDGSLKFFVGSSLYLLLTVKTLYWFLVEISLSFLCFFKRLAFISFQICPICSTSVGENMVGHITMQHGDVFNISFSFIV